MNSKACIHAAVVALTLATSSPLFAQNKQQIIETATEHLAASRNQEAIRLLEDLMAAGQFSESSDYTLLLNAYLSVDGGERRAIDLVDNGMKSGVIEQDLKTLLWLARQQYAANDIESSISSFQKAASLAPNGDTNVELAIVLANNGRFQEAGNAANDGLARGVTSAHYTETAQQILGLARSDWAKNRNDGPVEQRRAAKQDEGPSDFAVILGGVAKGLSTYQADRAAIKASSSPTPSYTQPSSNYSSASNTYSPPTNTHSPPTQSRPSSATTASAQKPDKNHCVSQVSSTNGITIKNSCGEPVEIHYCYTQQGPDSWGTYACHRPGQQSKFKASGTIPAFGSTTFPYSKGARAVWFACEKNVYAVVTEFVGDRVRAICR